MSSSDVLLTRWRYSNGPGQSTQVVRVNGTSLRMRRCNVGLICIGWFLYYRVIVLLETGSAYVSLQTPDASRVLASMYRLLEVGGFQVLGEIRVALNTWVSSCTGLFAQNERLT